MGPVASFPKQKDHDVTPLAVNLGCGAEEGAEQGFADRSVGRTAALPDSGSWAECPPSPHPGGPRATEEVNETGMGASTCGFSRWWPVCLCSS